MSYQESVPHTPLSHSIQNNEYQAALRGAKYVRGAIKNNPDSANNIRWVHFTRNSILYFLLLESICYLFVNFQLHCILLRAMVDMALHVDMLTPTSMLVKLS